jgi:NAD(P)H-flavin reductase
MLEFIAKENPALLRVIFKTNDTNLNPAQHPAITFIKDKFDASMIQRAKVLDERTSMVYICGPPSMNRAMLEAMKELKVDPSLYFIV